MIDFTAWIWPVLLAPFIGSFIGVLVTRVDAPYSVVAGRSSCAICQMQLGARDLIPFVSYLLSRGHCRHCGKAIGTFYPLIELAAVGVALWAATVNSGWTLWVSCALGWTLLALAVIDFKYYLLPDFLTLALIPTGLIAAYPLGLPVVIEQAIGAAAGYGFVILVRSLYRRLRGREGMGLGDAKLLSASGAWVSWQGLPSVIVIAAISGLTVTLLRRSRGVNISLTDRVPFGTFLCFGTWIVWLYGMLVIE